MKRSQMRRTAFRIKVNADKNSRPMLSRKAPLRGGCRLKANGRRTNDWRKAWRFLKPELEARRRIRCEFPFIDHECCAILDPAHSKKRREMQGNDIYVVAIACRNAHSVLDYEMTHSEMEQAVLRAINANGGLILPERKAA